MYRWLSVYNIHILLYSHSIGAPIQPPLLQTVDACAEIGRALRIFYYNPAKTTLIPVVSSEWKSYPGPRYRGHGDGYNIMMIIPANRFFIQFKYTRACAYYHHSPRHDPAATPLCSLIFYGAERARHAARALPTKGEKPFEASSPGNYTLNPSP